MVVGGGVGNGVGCGGVGGGLGEWVGGLGFMKTLLTDDH